MTVGVGFCFLPFKEASRSHHFNFQIQMLRREAERSLPLAASAKMDGARQNRDQQLQGLRIVPSSVPFLSDSSG
jgi:hypothetical protein